MTIEQSPSPPAPNEAGAGEFLTVSEQTLLEKAQTGHLSCPCCQEGILHGALLADDQYRGIVLFCLKCSFTEY